MAYTARALSVAERAEIERHLDACSSCRALLSDVERVASATSRAAQSQAERTSLGPGSRVDHFEVIRLLGRGGMGEVYSVVTYVEGLLSQEERVAIEEHLERCAACRGLVSDLARVEPEEVAPIESDSGPDVAHVAWSPPVEFEEFCLLRPLGHGAMGQVYLGRDRLLDRQVAIKFIAGSEPDTATTERFVTEAQAIARMQHPNVVAIHRIGEVEGRPFLVYELVRGRTLDQLDLPLPWPKAQRLGIGMARGLAAVHERGVLHRDIKPTNVMWTDQDEVKLLDFGLAKLSAALADPAYTTGPAIAADDAALTRTGMLIGTPLYLRRRRGLIVTDDRDGFDSLRHI